MHFRQGRVTVLSILLYLFYTINPPPCLVVGCNLAPCRWFACQLLLLLPQCCFAGPEELLPDKGGGEGVKFTETQSILFKVKQSEGEETHIDTRNEPRGSEITGEGLCLGSLVVQQPPH